MTAAYDLRIKQQADFLSIVAEQAETWLFAYGSLMWKRGFPARAYQATLEGWQRRFCIASTVYRGTPTSPGLVLGLAAGGRCQGQALLIGDDVVETMAAIWQREMTNGVYVARLLPVHLTELDTEQLCWCFVSDTAHRQYREPMSKAATLAIINSAQGSGGHNREYLDNTHEHLRSLGIDDEYVADLCR